MKLNTLHIIWHDKQPIFSCDFEPNNEEGKAKRFVTCGGDNNIRIWQLLDNTVSFVSTLKRHVKLVNCVRYSKKGDVIASGGDDGIVLLWRLSINSPPKKNAIGDEGSDDESCLEHWIPFHTLRVSDFEDIYDLCWSADDQFLLVGLTDNTFHIWDAATAKPLKILKDHNHFVQGVCWDPLNEYFATQSSDRTVRIYQVSIGKSGLATTCVNRISKMSYKVEDETEMCIDRSATPVETPKQKSYRMYDDETLVTFFRRLSFSPDGALLFTPAGIYRANEEDEKHGVYIFTRGNIRGQPVACLTGFKKAPILVRCNPTFFTLKTDSPYIKLPYRIVFAVVTLDEVYIYDTEQSFPISIFKNLHYSALTDAAWSKDGDVLLVTSTDGFCSVISFDEGDLGCKMEVQPEIVVKELKRDLENKENLKTETQNTKTDNVKTDKPNILKPKKRIQAMLVSPNPISIDMTIDE